MKKIWIYLVICLCLTGCSTSKGSFDDGNLNMELFFQNIGKEIENEKLDIAVLNDEVLTGGDIESLYGLDMTKIDAYMVKQSLISLESSEIAIFKVADDYDTMMEEAINKHKQDIIEEKTMIKGTQDVIEHSQSGRIGAYYYFILGQDSEKVVHYMQEY